MTKHIHPCDKQIWEYDDEDEQDEDQEINPHYQPAMLTYLIEHVFLLQPMFDHSVMVLNGLSGRLK